jgi:hypothetical protein
VPGTAYEPGWDVTYWEALVREGALSLVYLYINHSLDRPDQSSFNTPTYRLQPDSICLAADGDICCRWSVKNRRSDIMHERRIFGLRDRLLIMRGKSYFVDDVAYAWVLVKINCTNINLY